jgi:hypothetical protein
MRILIEDLDGMLDICELADVGQVHAADDVIYFAGVPYRLTTARPAADQDEQPARAASDYYAE